MNIVQGPPQTSPTAHDRIKHAGQDSRISCVQTQHLPPLLVFPSPTIHSGPNLLTRREKQKSSPTIHLTFSSRAAARVCLGGKRFRRDGCVPGHVVCLFSSPLEVKPSDFGLQHLGQQPGLGSGVAQGLPKSPPPPSIRGRRWGSKPRVFGGGEQTRESLGRVFSSLFLGRIEVIPNKQTNKRL